MGGSGRRSTARGSRPPRRAGPGRRDRRGRIPPRTGSNRSACVAGYPRPHRSHARVMHRHRRLDLRPSGYGSRNHPRTKAVVVLTILLIIIVLLLLFGGGGDSRPRGRILAATTSDPAARFRAASRR